MRTLLHLPLDPASRTVRIILAEKGLAVRLVETPPWRDDEGALAAANPALTTPVLIDAAPTGAEATISPVSAIVEYLDEAYMGAPMLPGASAPRAETRRLCAWFHDKFDREVNDLTLREHVDKRLMRAGQPDYERCRAGRNALAWHLDYLSWLFDRRSWLAGERMSAADIAGAAHLSALDYIGAVPWSDFPSVREWYARIKSRPSMRPILKDRIEGLPPPSHYDDLDF